MKALSSELPKHLTEVAGKPFLHFLLGEVAAFGYERVIVVIGHRADQMRAFLEDQPGHYIVLEQSMDGKYGTATVVEVAAAAVGDEPFVFLNGDALVTPDAFEAVSVDDGFAHIVGMPHERPEQYGVLSVQDGFLQEVVEKPSNPPGDLVNLGIYSFPPSVFSIVSVLEPSPRGEYELTDAVNELAAERQVKVHRLAGEWVDLGQPEDVPLVEDFIHRHNLV